jgi:hypothetical protein
MSVVGHGVYSHDENSQGKFGFDLVRKDYEHNPTLKKTRQITEE